MISEYLVKPYTIFNQRLDGFIYKYCETRERAEQICKELNGENRD